MKLRGTPGRKSLKRIYGADDVRGGAIRRDMTERIYWTRTSASRQTGNPGRRFFLADVDKDRNLTGHVRGKVGKVLTSRKEWE